MHTDMAFTRNLTKKFANFTIHDFSNLKNFKVSLYPTNAPKIIEVLWKPLFFLLKCNIDGSFSTRLTSCGVLFRDHNGDFVHGFSEMVDGNSSLHAKLYGVTRAIDITHQLMHL